MPTSIPTAPDRALVRSIELCSALLHEGSPQAVSGCLLSRPQKDCSGSDRRSSGSDGTWCLVHGRWWSWCSHTQGARVQHELLLGARAGCTAIGFAERFGVEVSIHKVGRGFQLYVRSKSFEGFVSVISPYIVPQMRYKLPIDPVTTSSQPGRDGGYVRDRTIQYRHNTSALTDHQ